jgi:hypothetical protein
MRLRPAIKPNQVPTHARERPIDHSLAVLRPTCLLPARPRTNHSRPDLSSAVDPSRSGSGPATEGPAWPRVFHVPGDLPRALVVPPARPGLTWRSRSAGLCLGRWQASDQGPQPGQLRPVMVRGRISRSWSAPGVGAELRGLPPPLLLSSSRTASPVGLRVLFGCSACPCL